MSKRLSFILIFLIALLIGAYAVVWNRQAAYYREASTAYLKKISSAPVMDGISIVVAHPEVSVTGFPFRHTLTLHHPDITVSVVPRDALAALNAAGATLPTSQHRAGDDVPIVYHLTASDDLRLILHYFTAHISADLTGDVAFTLTRGAESLSGRSEQPVDWHDDAAFRSGAAMPLLRSLFYRQPLDWKAMAPHLKALTMEGDASRLVASDTGEALSASGPVSFVIDNIHLNAEAPRFHIRATVADSEVFDRFQRFFKAITSMTPLAQVELTPFESHDVVGKTNIDLDIGVASNGDNSARSLGLPVQGQIDAKKLRFSNNLFQLSFPFFVEINTHDGLTGFKLQQPEASLAFSTAYDTAIEQTLHKTFADKAMREQLAAQFGAADKADTLADYISDVLPKMSGFGTMKTAIDISGNISDRMPPAINAGNIDVKKLRFSTDPYALNLSGSYDAPSKEGFLSLDCTHCPQMIADGVEYSNRVQKTLQALNPNRQATIITPEFYDAIVTFLGELNTSKDKEVLSLSVKASGDGGVTISGKPFQDVVMQAMQEFAPLLPSLTAPPAAAPPDTSEP